MSIPRTYAPTWGVGEVLGSAQINAIDESLTYAVDKRSGQSDVFASVLVATGAGRVISTVQTGPDASATFHVQDGTSLIRVPTLTAARSYTLGHTGATGGDRILVYYEGTGGSPSGYVDVKNNVGTGLARLGRVSHTSPNLEAEASAGEFIHNGSAWQLLRLGGGAGVRSITFTSSTTWVCPPGVFFVLLQGCGGGGGGGGGGSGAGGGAGAQNCRAAGGGGGGGAIWSTVVVPVTPGTSYTITIGAGGVGGTGAATGLLVGSSGSVGASTAFLNGATTLAEFVSSSPGLGGQTTNVTTDEPVGRGGQAGYRTADIPILRTGTISDSALVVGPQCGGFGLWSAVSGAPAGLSFGGSSGETVGGTSDTSMGAVAGSYLGGGVGGGGGAGQPLTGTGGTGGAGGAATNGGGGVGIAGSAGTSPTANTGAGGGGGGGGGSGSTTGGIGGNGAAGASGMLTLVMLK